MPLKLTVDPDDGGQLGRGVQDRVRDLRERDVNWQRKGVDQNRSDWFCNYRHSVDLQKAVALTALALPKEALVEVNQDTVCSSTLP